MYNLRVLMWCLRILSARSSRSGPGMYTARIYHRFASMKSLKDLNLGTRKASRARRLPI